MNESTPRIEVDRARDMAMSGLAVLVCAYDDDDKCRGMLLEGAMTWNEFQHMLDQVDADQEIILYCA